LTFNGLHGVISQKIVLFMSHKDWFRHSKLDGGEGGFTDTDTQVGENISLL
jgi:hypothetical protein